MVLCSHGQSLVSLHALSAFWCFPNVLFACIKHAYFMASLKRTKPNSPGKGLGICMQKRWFLGLAGLGNTAQFWATPWGLCGTLTITSTLLSNPWWSCWRISLNFCCMHLLYFRFWLCNFWAHSLIMVLISLASLLNILDWHETEGILSQMNLDRAARKKRFEYLLLIFEGIKC